MTAQAGYADGSYHFLLLGFVRPRRRKFSDLGTAGYSLPGTWYLAPWYLIPGMICAVDDLFAVPPHP